MTPKFFARLGLFALLGLVSIVVAPSVRADDPPMPPGMEDPGMGDPGMADPGMAEPGMAEPVPAAPAAKCEINEALAELERFKGYLKNRKADNADINASMDAVMKCFKGFLPADDAAKAGMTDVEKKYLDQVEDELMRAFLLVQVKGNSETNNRDDVNIKAAQALGQTRPAVTKDIIDGLETKIFKAKEYKPAPTLIEEAFKAIGTLNDHKQGLPYVVTYTTKMDNTAGRPERIKAAWDSLLLFKGVVRETRFEVVKNAVKTYTGPEHQAETNKTPAERSAKEVWDKIKGSVIKVVQSFAKDPKDPKTGNVIATMKGIEDWFRDNDKMGKPPWEPDTKPASAPPGPAPAK